MNKKTIKNKKILNNVVLSVVVYLFFIWLHSFIRLNSFSDGSVFAPIRTSLLVIGCTFLYYWCFTAEIEIDEPLIHSTREYAFITGVVGIGALVLLLLEINCEDIIIYSEKYIQFWIFKLEKKYLYDLYVVVIFPLVVQGVFRVLKKEKFSCSAVFFSSMPLIGMTIIGGLFFQAMSNAYLLDLTVLNTATIAFGIYKYALSDSHVRKGNSIAAIIIYAFFRILMLWIQGYWNGGFAVSMLSSWSDYIKGIQELIRNANFFGTSEHLLTNPFIIEWLSCQSNYIQQAFYYTGFLGVLVVMVMLAIFFITIFKLLGMANSKMHKNHLVFVGAFLVMAVRIIMGTAYALGVPYPIALVFAGKTCIITDSVCFALLLICAWQNYEIETYKNFEFISVRKYLGEKDTYKITDEDGDDYEEEFLYDVVAIEGIGGKRIVCETDWYEIGKREFCIFKPKGIGRKNKFVLECLDGKWIPVDDANLNRKLTEMYLENNIPESMEVMDDEED